MIKFSTLPGKGRMRVVQRPGPGFYPIAMIPGQFVDTYKVKFSVHLIKIRLGTGTVLVSNQK
jgi:hypothetical protein